MDALQDLSAEVQRIVTAPYAVSLQVRHSAMTTIENRERALT